MLAYEDVLAKGVYFIFSAEHHFYHLSICLAEGFQELGIPIFSNRNYWLTDFNKSTYLFSHTDDIKPEDCAICIVDILAQEAEPTRELVNSVLTQSTTKVILNHSDFEVWIPEFNEFNWIFRNHMTLNVEYPPNYIPWAFGISNRIQAYTANPLVFEERKREVLVNFRASFSQSVRVAMEFALVPWLETVFSINRVTEDSNRTLNQEDSDPFDYLNWLQLGGRHNFDYYDRLKQAMACCTYGGNFVYLTHGPGVARWDSWRLWESLAAGCVAIHLDFSKYGFLLPVMPENWKHYIGVDLQNLKDAVERIQDEPDLLAEISATGQKWALEHYSPLASACYFLDVVLGEEWGTTRSLISLLEQYADPD